MSTVSRVNCPHCEAECIEQEVNCWQCGKLLRPKPDVIHEETPVSANASDVLPDTKDVPKKEPSRIGALTSLFSKKPSEALPPPKRAEDLIRFEGEFGSAPTEEPPTESQETRPEQPTAHKATRVTLTGEVVEVAETPPDDRTQPVSPPPTLDQTQPVVAANIGDSQVVAAPGPELMVLTFCKNCGYQNPEGVRECMRCKSMLEVVEAGSVKEIEQLPRSWGFDVLGVVWLILGFAAVYCGQFLVKANANQHGATWADYFWTGVVVCAPGVFIFMRHYFCKTLFWVMTLGSILVWAVIFVVWITGHLFVTENAQVGLSWLLALSLLSAFSFFTVRVNDEFDFGS